MWRTVQSLPKTESSENTAPVLPILNSFLENYRQYLEGSVEEDSLGKTLTPTTWMFAGHGVVAYQPSQFGAPHHHPQYYTLPVVPLSEGPPRGAG